MENKSEKNPKKPRQSIGTMNVILVIVAILLIAFTVEMVILFRECGMIPDTLCACVFAALGGECGVMGWIKVTKEKKQERAWTLQDRQEEREKQATEIVTTDTTTNTTPEMEDASNV